MAKIIRIGHASTDEASASANEVLISNYYASLAPTVVLRPKTLELANKSAAACEAGCNNNNIEYSQSSRNTLNVEAKKVGYNLSSITTKCYADCSSFMTVCAIAGGAKLDGTSAPNCGNMRARFVQSGDYTALTDEIYLTGSDYLRRGDILVRETFLGGSRHTVMVLDNGNKVPDTGLPQTTPQIDLSQTAFTPVKVALNVVDIKTNKATIKAKLTKIENGEESDLAKSVINTYIWSYTVDALDTAETSKESIRVESSSPEFTLNSLLPGCSYRVILTATETGSDAMFSSPGIIFMTPIKKVANSKKIEFRDPTASAKKCKIFIKIKNVFNRAVLYNREV